MKLRAFVHPSRNWSTDSNELNESTCFKNVDINIGLYYFKIVIF